MIARLFVANLHGIVARNAPKFTGRENAQKFKRVGCCWLATALTASINESLISVFSSARYRPINAGAY
jgi:hypothetical protein